MRHISAVQRGIVGLAALAVIGTSHLFAQVTVGTWVRTDEKGKGLTMTVEACCNGGRRLIYQVPATGGHPAMSLTVDSPMDGTDAPALVGGKPSGQTMAVTRLDDHHYTAIVKMNGKQLSTSTATLSADGKNLTVEAMTNRGGDKPEKIVETWVKR